MTDLFPTTKNVRPWTTPRWLRFSLRTLLIMMTVLASVLGWCVFEREKVRQQMAALRKDGVDVGMYGSTNDVPEMQASLRGFLSKTLWGDVLLTDVEYVNYVYRQTCDEDLVHLRGLNRLITVDLRTTSVTGAGLGHLEDLPLLKIVTLNSSQVTAEGVSHLQKMRSLKTILVFHSPSYPVDEISRIQAALPGCSCVFSADKYRYDIP